MEKYKEGLVSYSQDNCLEKEIEIKRELISNSVLSGDINIIESTRDMDILARDTILKITRDLIECYNLDENNLPFAIFFFGSPSRNLMLPNSDMDIGLIFSDSCEDSLKNKLRERILSLPFDKIDIASWSDIDSMRKNNCLDMIEYNKAIDAKFISGGYHFYEQYLKEVKSKDTKEDKTNRFITEFGLLHQYDYLNKRTNEGNNLKYDFGASRDIIFIDWFYLINCNEDKDIKEPYFLKGLEFIEDNKILSSDEVVSVKEHIELILLVKFVLLSKFRKNNNDTLLKLNNFSLHEAYGEAKNAFINIGIEDGDKLVNAYYKAKLSLYNLVKNLYFIVSKNNLELTNLWETAKTKEKVDEELLNLLKDKNWFNLVPFAIHTKSPEILDLIVSSVFDLVGYEYILRIVSENSFLSEKTKFTLLKSRLPEKYKKKLNQKIQ